MEQLGGATVLIVDDEPDVARSFEHMLGDVVGTVLTTAVDYNDATDLPSP